MKALEYNGPGLKALEDWPKPNLNSPTDAIVKITKTTICGTDLHILKGDVATCKLGTVLGHEGVGVVDAVGSGVTTFKPGDHVLISCISACGRCEPCRKGMYSHCTTGGWILGNSIDGTQAEFVRIPHADTSLYPISKGADEEALVMLSDVLPTGFECGVLNGKIQPGSTVAIVGSGPIGLAALLTAQFYAPSEIIMIEVDESRLAAAKRFGATATVNSSNVVHSDTARQVMALTGGRGVDTAIEAVGIPATFTLCEDIVAAGGTIAKVGLDADQVRVRGPAHGRLARAKRAHDRLSACRPLRRRRARASIAARAVGATAGWSPASRRSRPRATTASLSMPSTSCSAPSAAVKRSTRGAGYSAWKNPVS